MDGLNNALDTMAKVLKNKNLPDIEKDFYFAQTKVLEGIIDVISLDLANINETKKTLGRIAALYKTSEKEYEKLVSAISDRLRSLEEIKKIKEKELISTPKPKSDESEIV